MANGDTSNQAWYAKAAAYAPTYLILLILAVNYVLPPIASLFYHAGEQIHVDIIPVPIAFVWAAVMSSAAAKYFRSMEKAGGLPPWAKSNGK